LATLYIYNSLDFPDSIAINYCASSQKKAMTLAEGEAWIWGILRAWVKKLNI
jgi:hypothetical protein